MATHPYLFAQEEKIDAASGMLLRLKEAAEYETAIGGNGHNYDVWDTTLVNLEALRTQLARTVEAVRAVKEAARKDREHMLG